jgi:hypothetical protein
MTNNENTKYLILLAKEAFKNKEDLSKSKALLLLQALYITLKSSPALDQAL